MEFTNDGQFLGLILKAGDYQMKKSLFAAIFIAIALCRVVGASVEPQCRIDVDGTKEGIGFKPRIVNGGLLEYADWYDQKEKNKTYLQSHFPAGEWKNGSFTFTPRKTGNVAIGLRGVWAQNENEMPWILISDITIDGAETSGDISNLSEWYREPKAELSDSAKTAGTKAVKVSYKASAYHTIKVMANVHVTISFWYKSAAKADVK